MSFPEKQKKARKPKPVRLPFSKKPVTGSLVINEDRCRHTMELAGSNGFLFAGTEFAVSMGLSLGISVEAVEEFLSSYFCNTRETIDVEPLPTPRPRAGVMKFGKKMSAYVYHPEEYTHYKIQICNELLLKTHLKQKHYYGMVAWLYLPYPQGEAKMRTYENRPHEKKPDFDNLIKGFVDAMVDSGLLIDDGKLHTNCIFKRYTQEKVGRIEFILLNYFSSS